MALATLVGCNGLFGIGNQDASAGASSGAAGAAGDLEMGGRVGPDPDGGASTASAGSGEAAGTGLTASSAGAMDEHAQGGGGAGNHPALGASGASGDGASGDGASGDGASGDGATIQVAGKLENLWGYPLNGVTMNVRSASGSSSSVTNATGAFSIEGVATPYEAFFVVPARGWDGHVTALEGWAFQGLTRRDPVFRVERGGRESSSDARLDTQGLDASLEPFVGFAVGTPYGQGSVPLWLQQGQIASEFGVPVSGPETADGRAHALSFLVDSNTQLPTSYLAYASQPIRIDTNKLHSDLLTLDLSPPTPELTVGAITGTVTGDSIVDRENWVWLMFESNAALQLAHDERPRQASFSYNVPALPASTLMVSASVGSSLGGLPQAIGYRGGLLPGQSGIEVRIPDIASPTTPLEEAPISADTPFSWQTTAAVSVLVVTQISELEVPRRLHVVVAGNTARIPDTLLNDMDFDSTHFGSWTVESHGDFSDVDATVSAAGFLSPFFQGEPSGPPRASGWYARSRAVPCGFSP